jgi:hypothetical protein
MDISNHSENTTHVSLLDDLGHSRITVSFLETKVDVLYTGVLVRPYVPLKRQSGIGERSTDSSSNGSGLGNERTGAIDVIFLCH